MNLQINLGPPWIKHLTGTAAVVALVAGLAFVPQSVHANLAAGTTISNTATVNYDDAVGTAQAAVNSNTVDVTVALVGAVSWGAAPGGQTRPSAAVLSPAYTFTIINGGNGADTFALTDGTTESVADLAAGTFTVTGDAANSITLHGTIASGIGVFAAGVTTIPVYYQDIANLTAGTTVVRINAVNYTVAAGSTATSLVVTGNATVGLADGTQIGEVGTVTYAGSVGVLSAPSTTATHDHSIGVTGTSQGGNAAATAAALTWSTTVTRVALTVQKYVRNFTDANDNPAPGSGFTFAGNEYFASGVTGNANAGGGGDLLEYLVVITNTGGGNATDVTFTDTLSTFTTYKANSARLDIDGDGVWDFVSGLGGETDAVDVGGTITVGGGTITVRAGSGGDEGAGTPVGGTILPAGTSVIFYQVNLN